MSFRITTNVASLGAQRSLHKAQRETEDALKSIASGSRIVNAGDDAAGFAIAESLRGQLSGVRQARFNAQNATSLIQTAEGGLNEQNNILIRLRELAVYSASDTLGDEEREFLNKEFTQLVQENDRIAKSTRFGNKKLLTGTGEEFEFQIGAYRGPENTVKFSLESDTTSSNLGISGLDISDRDEALSALDDIDGAIMQIGGARSTFGAMQSRLQHAADALEVQGENLEIARSNIVDVDLAEATTRLAKAQILQDTGTAVLAQANQNSQRIMRLLN
jgi:flagellin